MLDQDRPDLFLLGAFVTIVFTIVAVSFGYTLAMFAGLFGFFVFLYFWLMSGLRDTNGDSTSA